MYELFDDTLQLQALPVGVYLVEMESTPATKVSRQLLFVSNVRTLMENLPGSRQRYVVVDAVEGQPIKGATIELRGYANGRGGQLLAWLKTDAKGEASYQYDKQRPTQIYAYTSADKACPPKDYYGNFSYYDNDRRAERAQLFTDRAIYRPGQTVHVAAVAYEVLHGYEQKALADKQLTLTLRDANYKEVAQRTLTTDRFGTCATDFTLPSNGLTGNFSIEMQNGRCHFRVEEYKQPKFMVSLDDPALAAADEAPAFGRPVTIRGRATAYSGASLSGAKVKYHVVRQGYWRWKWFAPVEVANDSTTASADGTARS